MSPVGIAILVLLFLVTSATGVVTGSNSLITVPVMFQFGIDEKVAVATNMFGLTFMAIGATIPFVRARKIEYGRVSPLAGLTLIGSAIGASLVGVITGPTLKLIVSIAMIAVAAFTLLHRNDERAGFEGRPAVPAAGNSATGSLAVFSLAIYGGLYSGGYVTILTAALVAFYGMKYSESIASTKFINVFSSGVATLIFMWQGLVDYQLGAILAVTMFAGAYGGAHFVMKMNETWLRRIFLSTVVILAVKTLWDLFG